MFDNADIRLLPFTTTTGETFEVPFIVDDDLYTNGLSTNSTRIETTEDKAIQDTINAFHNSEFAWTSKIPFYYPLKGKEYSDTVMSVIYRTFPHAKPIDFTSDNALYIGEYSWNTFRTYITKSMPPNLTYSCANEPSSTSLRPRFPIVSSSTGKSGYSTEKSFSFGFECSVIPSTCIDSNGRLSLSDDKLVNEFREFSISIGYRTDYNYIDINCSCSTISNHDYGNNYTLLNGMRSLSLTNLEQVVDPKESALKSWLTGLIYEMAIRGLLTKPKTIIPDDPDMPVSSMYLYGTPAQTVVTYNSVELPDIEDVWSDVGKEAFPYATIFENNTLYISNKKARYNISSKNIIFLSPTAFAKYKLENNTWVMDGSIVEGSSSTTADVIWSNDDILNDDGTIYLSGSDPVRTRIGGNIALRISKEEEVKSIMYFYGVQSDNGGIGLRSGAAVTKYDGAVLPNIDEVWTDKETHPYAFIVFAGGLAQSYQLWLTPEITYGESGSGDWCFGYVDGAMYYSEYDGEWKNPINSATGGLYGTIDSVIWSNADILNKDGSVGHAKSEPISITKDIIGYAYYRDSDSTVPRILPLLPEYDTMAYPYAIMEYLDNDEWKGDGALAHFRATNTSWTYYGTGGFYPSSSGADTRLECFISIDNFEDGWNEPIYGEYKGHIGSDGVTSMSWTNHTINQYSGSWVVNSWKKSPDPIPVYDIYVADNNSDTIVYYNGVVLPELPEWDKSKYPYAGIMTTNGNYMLIVTDAMAVQNTGILSSCTWDTEDGKCAFVSWVFHADKSSVWEFSTSSEHGSPIGGSCEWKWANHDVYNQSGNLYLSATDHIPVSGVVDTINDIPIYEDLR